MATKSQTQSKGNANKKAPEPPKDQDAPENEKKGLLLSISSVHEGGHRRADIRWPFEGKNVYEDDLSEEQMKAIKADRFLRVTLADED
ncbi:hypothetical protein SAMN04488527_101260 [Aliiroseovarius crassostreae]|uniref:Mu-like prophage FluMu N-terminal domain-containing protein n=1 Tax=Aliiroseovarius crassostreae TaxID=154981 RepID=A0A0N8IBW7_9RHOB|nr:hypothetical protein [Aliiroseovarius crassostreae]KPN64259.1 hypothetical protein AKJ29_16625 [Aliiroseovarius crassostreae]SFU31145.1 hypothetical protein SAMN04488527_101260 [Aliiroseovarius crassostreae]